MYYTILLMGKTEAQKGKVACSRSNSKSVADAREEPKSPDSLSCASATRPSFLCLVPQSLLREAREFS